MLYKIKTSSVETNVKFKANNLPSWLTLSDDGWLSGTPPLISNNTTYTFDVTAIHTQTGTVIARTFSLTVVNSSPVLGELPVFVTNENINTPIPVTDANLDTLSVTVSGELPPGLELVNKSFVGVIDSTANNKNYNFTLTADDGRGGITNRTYNVLCREALKSAKEYYDMGFTTSTMQYMKPVSSSPLFTLYAEQSLFGGGYTRVARFDCNNIGAASQVTAISDSTNGYLSDTNWGYFRDNALTKEIIAVYKNGTTYIAKTPFSAGYWHKFQNSLLPVVGAGGTGWAWAFVDPGRDGVNVDYTFIGYRSDRGFQVYNYGGATAGLWNGTTWTYPSGTIAGAGGVLELYVR